MDPLTKTPTLFQNKNKKYILKIHLEIKDKAVKSEVSWLTDSGDRQTDKSLEESSFQRNE